MRKQPFAILLLAAVSACGSVTTKGVGDARATFQHYVQSNAKVPVDNPTSKDGDVILAQHEVGSRGEYGNREVHLQQKNKLTQNFERMVAFDPNATVLYPGAIVTGKSLISGVLTPLVTARNTQVCTLADIASLNPAAKFSGTFAPSVQAWDDFARLTLGNQLNVEQPAKISFEQTTVHSFEQAYMDLGASYHWMSGNAGMHFSTQRASAKSSFMVRLVQKYYTASCAQPAGGYMALFPTSARFEHINAVLADGTAPAYVDSVTFGRELWMLVESDEEVSKASADLHAALNGVVAGGSLDADAGASNFLRTATIQVYAIGGDGVPAMKLITGDPAALQQYLLAGANFSNKSPGAPISYVARYLIDNSVARISSTTDYVIDTWVKGPRPAPATSATITWSVTGQHQKDWNTQARAYLKTTGGKTLASIECCSSAKKDGDEWHVGDTPTRPMGLVPDGFTDVDIRDHGLLEVGSRPVGNNNWEFSATVTVYFADKSTLTKSCRGTEHCSAQW